MKRIIFGTISIILIIGIIGIFDSSSALAETGWDDCPRGETDCEYPGICRSYVDTNNDGICDRGQPAPQEDIDGDLIVSSEYTSEMTVQVIGETGDETIDDNGATADASESSTDNEIAIIAGLNDSESTGDNTTDGSSRLSYYLGPIVLIIGILYGLSYLLSAKHIIKVVVHRRIWNVVLLVSTIISALLGLVLILGIDFSIDISLPFNSLFWHVESGVAMGLIAVFHIMWHLRYFQKMLKFAS